MTDDTGRRIYIHEVSLAGLARESPELAEQIMQAMCSLSAVKVAHSYLRDLVSLGDLTGSDADSLRDCIGGGYEPITNLLRCLEAKPIGRKKAERLRLLNEHESIVSSCYFSGYYTFATSERAAVLMFDDTNSISEMRRSYDPSEITLIRGRSLWPLGEEQSDELLSNEVVGQVRSRVIMGYEKRIDECLKGKELPDSGEFKRVLLGAIDDGVLSKFGI